MIIGEIRIFAGAIPPGWLPLGSGPVSRTTYAELFLYLGTTWGAGDGLTTFGLPPAERVPIPAGAQAGLTTRALGDTGGDEAVTLTSTQSGVPNGVSVTVNDAGHTHGPGTLSSSSHIHALSNNATCTLNDPGHTHSVNPELFVVTGAGSVYESSLGTDGTTRAATDSGLTGISAAMSGSTETTAIGLDGGNTSSATTGITAETTAAAAADSHENMPPFAVYNFAIYAGS